MALSRAPRDRGVRADALNALAARGGVAAAGPARLKRLADAPDSLVCEQCRAGGQASQVSAAGADKSAMANVRLRLVPPRDT